MNSVESNERLIFEDIKHIDEFGNEYWEARELQKVLGYKERRYFSAVIEKAQIACSGSNNDINPHFGVYTKIIMEKRQMILPEERILGIEKIYLITWEVSN